MLIWIAILDPYFTIASVSSSGVARDSSPVAAKSLLFRLNCTVWLGWSGFAMTGWRLCTKGVFATLLFGVGDWNAVEELVTQRRSKNVRFRIFIFGIFSFVNIYDTTLIFLLRLVSFLFQCHIFGSALTHRCYHCRIFFANFVTELGTDVILLGNAREGARSLNSFE